MICCPLLPIVTLEIYTPVHDPAAVDDWFEEPGYGARSRRAASVPHLSTIQLRALTISEFP